MRRPAVDLDARRTPQRIDELYGLGYDNDKSYEARINQVTVADVQQLVKEYFQKAIIATSSPETE